jgi:hypothetical protein
VTVELLAALTDEVRPMRGWQRPPSSTRAGRFVRGWRLDDNPLRRASDRAETLVLIVLAAVFLVCAPLVAPAAGGRAHAAAQRAALAQAASWTQVTAVVVTKPPRPVVGYEDYVATAPARWTAPDGAIVTGAIPVPVGTKAGAKVRVWTTRDGQLTSPPLTGSQVASLTGLAEFAGVAGLAVALALAGALARWWLNRRRLAGWDADWQATEPRWTARA